MSTRYRIFAGVTPGLEDLLAEELGELGLAARPAVGGVELAGTVEAVWGVALRSRLAESVRVRVGREFTATSFALLQDRVARLPWAVFIRRGGPAPRVSVTCHKSRLHHSGAVAERVAASMTERLGLISEKSDERSDEQPGVYVRLMRDRVLLSVDAGERLHRRGYRTRVGQAPLRETLAAACLRAAGYHGQRPLWDPFCGSGTLVIEAASMAAGVVPGGQRSFAFERWPAHDAQAYLAYRQGLPGDRQPTAAVLGTDHDPGAVAAARANAGAAGVDRHTTFRRADVEAAARQVPVGAMVVSNPPYGHRLDSPELASTFRRLGAVLRRRPDLQPVVLLSGHGGLPRLTGLPWATLRSLKNRGLAVRLLQLDR